MRRDLSLPLPPSAGPVGVTLVPFSPSIAQECRALLDDAYAQGFGDIIPFAEWWSWLTSDSEYDPALCFVAVGDGALIGFCHCWTSAFVKDIAVAESARRRGIGTLLLARALEVFAKRGARHVDLKTDVDNHDAQALYRRLGFTIVELITP